jgi:hypothetical protein
MPESEAMSKALSYRWLKLGMQHVVQASFVPADCLVGMGEIALVQVHFAQFPLFEPCAHDFFSTPLAGSDRPRMRAMPRKL